jgi:threonine dehydrogenase-like Zn-dependent dehydrogenase
MEEDRIRPMAGIGRELNVQFALGYDPTEFGGALHALADGTTSYPEIVTGTVDVEGVPQAFTDLDNPEAHAKILVEP